MKLVIMQPYLFPYIGYFQLLAAADRFVVYDDVQFIKGGWINRNQLLVNGQPWLFTVPLDQPSPNRLIREIGLRPAQIWQPKFLRTVAQSYSRAPQFEVAYSIIERIFAVEANTIADLVRNSLHILVQYLDLPVIVIPTSDIYNNAHLRAQSRVIDICRQENSTNYINAKGGRELYDGESFKRAGMKLQFLQPELLPYKQMNSKKFVPGMSIIDVIMNNSVSETKTLLQQYTLLPG